MAPAIQPPRRDGPAAGCTASAGGRVGRHSGNKWQIVLRPDGGVPPARDERETMRPLLFVNWSAVSSMFRGLMWIAAIVLAAVIVIHLVPASAPVHHAAHLMR